MYVCMYVCMYSLCVSNWTGQFPLPTEEVSADMYRLAVQILTREYGMEFYLHINVCMHVKVRVCMYVKVCQQDLKFM